MESKGKNRSIAFFDAQFRRQVATGDLSLNPFEARVLPYLGGSVLELGCGLGNLSIAAAARGAHVMALDACGTAVESLEARARLAGLNVTASAADLSRYTPPGPFDAVVAIGLFMFFPRELALESLRRAIDAVGEGGVFAANVLIEGTTYMDMFDTENGYYLFGEDALRRSVATWQLLDDRVETFDAPGTTVKRFSTVIARRPAAGGRPD